MVLIMMKSICFKGSTPSELRFSFFVPPALPVVIDVSSLRDDENNNAFVYEI